MKRTWEERADRVYLFLCLPGLRGVVLKSCETGSEGMGLWMQGIVWESCRSMDDIQVLV